jgi:uncharacterized membrane protein
VPRVVNVALAVVLLACISPAVVQLRDRPGWVQVLVVLLCLPVLLVVAACLASAARPGSLGRVARRVRHRA